MNQQEKPFNTIDEGIKGLNRHCTEEKIWIVKGEKKFNLTKNQKPEN